MSQIKCPKESAFENVRARMHDTKVSILVGSFGESLLQNDLTGLHLRYYSYFHWESFYWPFLICFVEAGHSEVVRVQFNPAECSYGNLLDAFWRQHDPTTSNRQV